MPMKPAGFKVAAVVATVIGTGWSVRLTGQVPLGHRDFYPSAERPVGWRGDGSGAFPGAAPVTTWRDGETELVEMDVENWGDAGGNARGTFKRRKVAVFKNANSVNIVWKTEMPSYANSSPIVVGDRVFTTAEPNWLVCVDAHTGKIIWQRSNNPFELMDLPPEEVKRNTTLMEAAGAVLAACYRVVGNYYRIHPSQMTPKYWKEWRENFAEVRKSLEPVAALDDRGGVSKTLEDLGSVVNELDRLLKGGDAKEGEGKKQSPKLRQLICAVMGGGGTGLGANREPIVGWMVKEYEIHPWHHWNGWEGWTFATPVSDGRHVFVAMGQRQAACYDLNGNRIWARMVPLPKPADGRRLHLDARDGGHLCSPVLAGNVLVVQVASAFLVGLDKATGRTLWELGEKPANAVATPRAMRWRDGTWVIVRKGGQVVRAKDGKVLPARDVEGLGGGGGSASVVGFGDVVVSANAASVDALRLVPEGEGVRGERLWSTEKPGTATQTTWIVTDGFVVSPRGLVAERQTGQVPVEADKGRFIAGGYTSPILAGRYVISLADCGGGGGQGITTRVHKDEVVCPCWVAKLGDEGKVTLVTRDNVLGGQNKPRMPILEKYMPEAYKRGMWCRENGVPDHWGYGSPFAQGNRIFIRSCSHLYCIGDPKVPYDWNPASRPKEVTAQPEAATRGSRE